MRQIPVSQDVDIFQAHSNLVLHEKSNKKNRNKDEVFENFINDLFTNKIDVSSKFKK